MNMFLLLLGGIGWTIVYIGCIRLGFKDKAYAMPLFALGLNIAWEAIYAMRGLLIDTSAQTYVNLTWMCLDIAIIYTYFKFGRKEFPENAKKYFVPFSIMSFITCAVIELAFFITFEPLQAAQYSAFAQNAAMSVLFLVMLFRRNSTRGQSMLIAVAKCIGTLAPTLQQGVLWEINPFIIITGAVCFVFDIIYIVMLYRFKKNGSF